MENIGIKEFKVRRSEIEKYSDKEKRCAIVDIVIPDHGVLKRSLSLTYCLTHGKQTTNLLEEFVVYMNCDS